MFTNSGVNKVFLIGYIQGEPILQELPRQQQMLSFTLKTTESLQPSGKEMTEYHHIKVIREIAIAGPKQLKQGQLVYLEGKIKTHSYYDEQQIKRYILEIDVARFSILAEAAGVTTFDSEQEISLK